LIKKRLFWQTRKMLVVVEKASPPREK